LVESFRKRRQLPRWLYLQFRHWKKIHGASKENTMPNTHDMLWFKQQFRQKIEPAIAGTPFTVDFLTALACQETGEVWPILRKKDLSLDRILELCVGDTKDAHSASDPRDTWPATKEQLLAAPNGKGQQMFDLARQALIDMAKYVHSYDGPASPSHPTKFCHGFGIFQYDIQFFEDQPEYFLDKQYANFDACLQKCLKELREQADGIGLGNQSTLSDRQLAYVAIAYNIGSRHFRESRGLDQGYRGDGGKRYGRWVYEYLQTAKTVHDDDGEHPAASGTRYEVTSTNPLRLRSEATSDEDDPNANVLARLPHGHVATAITNHIVNGFLEVETDLEGHHYSGFASAQYLKRV